MGWWWQTVLYVIWCHISICTWFDWTVSTINQKKKSDENVRCNVNYANIQWRTISEEIFFFFFFSFKWFCSLSAHPIKMLLTVGFLTAGHIYSRCTHIPRDAVKWKMEKRKKGKNLCKMFKRKEKKNGKVPVFVHFHFHFSKISFFSSFVRSSRVLGSFE